MSIFPTGAGNPNTIPGTGQGNMPTAGGGSPVSNLGDLEKLLGINLGQQVQAVQQRVPIMPQQLPAGQNRPGDVSGNFVNPSTSGGPAHNARVSLAQSIGQLVANVENKHEEKKARDVAFDMQRIQTAMSNPTPENQQLVEEILQDPSRRKAISKALNINFFGEDKRKPAEKQAYQMWSQMNDQQKQQAAQQPQALNQQLMRQMPKMPSFSADDQFKAQAIQMGLSPKADEVMKTLTALAGDQTKWNVAMANIDAKDREHLQKLILQGQKYEALYEIAKLHKQGVLGAASMRAGAENRRSDVLQQNNQLQVELKTRVDNNKIIEQSLKAQADSLKGPAGNPKLSDKERKDAQAQLAIVNDQLQHIAQNTKDLNSQVKGLQNANNAATTSSGNTGGEPTDSIEDVFKKYGIGDDLNKDED